LREKIVLTSSAVFPTCDITYLRSRVSQAYIATNQWGIELSSNVTVDISNEYLYRGGERVVGIVSLQESKFLSFKYEKK